LPLKRIAKLMSRSTPITARLPFQSGISNQDGWLAYFPVLHFPNGLSVYFYAAFAWKQGCLSAAVGSYSTHGYNESVRRAEQAARNMRNDLLLAECH
jgi:hypothetical protein